MGMKHSMRLYFTIFSLLLSAVCIFGSMAVMNVMLRTVERRLLSESGKAIVGSPVRAWEEAENSLGDMIAENPGRSTYTLTYRQMEEAVGSWNARTGETLHNPVAGQISMEEAILAGEMWLAEMGMEENRQETDTHSVNAMLGIPKQEELSGQLEPYYSFWTVQFFSGSMNAVLYVNAVTGKVLSAEVALYRNLPDKLSVEELGTFVELAGLQGNETETVFDSDGTLAFLTIDGSRLCAEMELRREQKGYFDLTHQGSVDVGPDFYHNEYVVITYKLYCLTVKISE